ncbi:ABC transporter permease [Enterococcus hulanensis]|uniref:ABC transporter permease n=1 Tax=Enterococcus TaxID=1350 RepID=UPI000B5A277C|nr:MULTISPECIES: ABC transporter permease [Enterococcus]MBO0413456.1 ABC transporter permease [Enterococcus hulanensis]OTO20730.1 hypothetical protein A5875_002083 [Enterococcus sp. 3H8_DIV0648]
MEITQSYIKKTTIKSVINDTFVMVKRDLLKTKHNPDKLMDVTFMPIFFMIIFSYLFGGAIAGGVSNYLPIIVPGILIQTLVSSTSAAGTQLREDIETGVFDRFKSLPIAQIAPLAGLLISDMVRYAIATFFSLGTGFILGWRPGAGYGWLFVACLLTIFVCWCVSWIFAMIGILVKSSATISGVSMTLTMLLSFLSNAFVPIDTLPSWLKTFAELNPVTHLVNSFKALADHGVFGADTWLTIATGVLIVLIFAPLTVTLYSKNV